METSNCIQSQNSKRKNEIDLSNNRCELTKDDKKVQTPHCLRQKHTSELKNMLSKTVTIDTSKAGGDLDVVRLCAREFRWIEYPQGRRNHACDITWSHRCYDTHSLSRSVFNKFPGMMDILSKVNLSWSLSLMQKIFPEAFDFYPRTWPLPHEFNNFASDVTDMYQKSSKSRPTFIVKPDDGSQGAGIYLIKDPADYVLSQARSHIVQEYIRNPLLLDGYKFDLRIYATIRSVNPLDVYVCREGLVRFCTIPYETPTTKNMTNSFMHLTNYSLNKKSSTFCASDFEDKGSKQTLTSILRRLSDLGYESESIWQSIQEIICKTIFAIEPQILVMLHTTLPFKGVSNKYFQVLGFDILLRDDLKPILLEVNSNPSLRIDHEQETRPGVIEHVPSHTDKIVKAPMLRDSLLMVAPKNKMADYYNRKMRSKHRKMKKENKCPEIKMVEAGLENHLPDIVCSENTDLTIGQTEQNTCCDKESCLNDDYRESPCSDVLHGKLQRVESPYLLHNTTLQRLYPTDKLEHYEVLRLSRRIAKIFLHCLGVRGNTRLGPTAFRAFTRKCALTRRGLSTADVDILYIDIQRRWEHLSDDRRAGLCYKGFIDAFLEIAKRKFYSTSTLEMVESLVNFCEENINFSFKSTIRTSRSRSTSNKFPIISPAMTPSRRHLSLDQRPRLQNIPHKPNRSFSFLLDYGTTSNDYS